MNVVQTAVHLTLALLASGSTQAPSSAPSDALAQWRRAHGTNWRFERDEGAGFVRMLYGGRKSATHAPRNETDAIEFARQAVRDTRDLHGVDDSTLVSPAATFLPLGQAGSVDKWTVRFAQRWRQVLVVDGSVNVLIDSEGALLSVQSNGLAIPPDFSTTPALGAARATEIVGADFNARRHATLEFSADAAELVIAQAQVATRREPRLAWQIDVWDAPGTARSEGWRYWIDARTGELLGREDNVHSLDVHGWISTNATPGTLPDTSSNPPWPQAVTHLRVEGTDGNNNYVTYSDATGFFSFSGISIPLNCTMQYTGEFCDVVNVPATAYSMTVPATTLGQAYLMNSSPSATTTAQANAFINTNRLRDYVRSVVPGDATADVQFQVFVNDGSDSCNSLYLGNNVRLYAAGGGCVNMSYSSIVLHELGHWLNDLYQTNNSSDGMGEGNADAFAMYVLDDPFIGPGVAGANTFFRSGWNTRQFCGDTHPSCHGEKHADGEVWMGAAWKIRDNLNTSLGNSAGDLVADTLFLGWLNAYDQRKIKSIIECQWLVLDDDDGNLANGTPHFAEIDAGFRAQGFPGIDYVPVLRYSFNASSYLGHDDSGHWHDGTVLAATTNTGISGQALEFLPNNNLPEFETSHDVTLDILGAMTGMAWIKPFGQQSTDNNPSCTKGTIFSKGGNYWFQIEKDNDQIVFQNEDSGTDLVRVPATPVPGLIPVGQWTHVAFVREANGKKVRIYVNGALIGVDSLVNAAVSTTLNVTYGNYGFGGPADCEFNGLIDDIRIFNSALCDECVADLAVVPPLSPFAYCTAMLNSAGCLPAMSFSGVPSGSAPNGFVIGASNILSSKNGLLFYGLNGPHAAPFGGGLLCVKAPLQRTPVLNSGGSPFPPTCSGNFSFDFNTLIASGVSPNLVAGATVNAQFWYRDPGFVTGFGLSDGLEFTIEN